MNEDLARVAAAIGEPTRAAMLAVLSDGRAYPAGQLARATGTRAQTASFHLDRLLESRLVVRLKQGRHSYYALAGEAVANALEALALVTMPRRGLTEQAWRGSESLRFARTCYGHLAGKAGVALLDGLLCRGYLEDTGAAFALTAEGATWCSTIGVSKTKLKQPQGRKCLDWSERRPHLAGSLGVAMTKQLIDLGWFARKPDTRALRLTPLGRESLQQELGVNIA